MWRVKLLRIAAIVSIIPIPALIVSLVLLTVNSALGGTMLGSAITILLAIAGGVYLLSIAMGMLAGVIWGSRLLLLPPVISIMDVGLFALSLPPQESSVGWRLIDAVLLGLLCILNIAQVCLLRRQLRSVALVDVGEDDNVGQVSNFHIQ